MQVAALYDIHGNLPALEAVLREIKKRDVDQIVVGGDVVLGPMTRECIDRLREIQIPVHFVRGNCEAAVLDEMAGKPLPQLPENVLEDIRWTARQHFPDHRELLGEFHDSVSLEIAGFGRVYFCHATPQSNTKNFTRLTPQEKLLPLFGGVSESVAVCGHTHMQFDINIGSVRVVNAGSVGMPFGNPGADWLLIDQEIKLRHTNYDLKDAAEQILKTDYPNRENFVENHIFNPPPEKQMLEIFT